MKKKSLIIVSIIILILLITCLFTSYIDSARVRNGVEPKYVIKLVNKSDNKVTYLGLGYKIILYPSVSFNEPYKNNRGVKFGSWFMKYEVKEDKYEISLEEIYDHINNYFLKVNVDKSNMAHWGIFENKIVVGMLDISLEKQEEFINNVFSSCCGSKYIEYIMDNEIIKFVQSKDVFDAKIIDAGDNYIVVEVLKNSKSFKKNDKVRVTIVRPTSGVNDFYVVGNNVRITFNGMVETSNPAQIGANKIELITN